MTDATNGQPDERAMRTLKTLAALAIVSALIAAAAGVALWLAEPDAGSSLEATLGIVAAVSGLAVAAFAVAAAIYAQVKNLWRYAPMWVRVGVMAIIVAGIVVTIVRWLD